jgi:hypothetical protein
MSSSAFAQSAVSTGAVTIDGKVAERCLFTTPSAMISIPELAGTDGKLAVATVDGQTRNLAGWCNGTAATMRVTAEPLLNVDYTGTTTGFDTRVDYTAMATANSVPGTDSSVGAIAPGASVVVGLFTGTIPVVLSASSSPTGGLLVAGDYLGQVLVTLSPAV